MAAMTLVTRLHSFLEMLRSNQTLTKRLHKVNLRPRKPLRVPTIQSHDCRARLLHDTVHEAIVNTEIEVKKSGVRPDTRRARHWRHWMPRFN